MLIGQIKQLVNNSDTARQFVRQHLIVAQLTLDQLTANRTLFYSLEGSSIDLIYRVGRCSIH